MARVTEDEVRAIIEVDSSLTTLTPFIDVATLMVTETLDSSGLSDDRLKEIEKWLAAHFVAVRDPRRSREEVEGAAETYQYKLGDGLQSTMYGQQVLLLDTTGLLKSGGRAASIQAMR